MNINVQIGLLMREERTKKKMSLQEVADKMNLGKTTISAYELGKIAISVENLQKYCEIVGCDFYKLMYKLK